MSETGWKGRSLENYKEMHKQTAKDKKCYERFMACRTLTEARKVLFGVKVKNTKLK